MSLRPMLVPLFHVSLLNSDVKAADVSRLLHSFFVVEVSTGKTVFTANFSDNIFFPPGFMVFRDTYVLYLRFKNEN